ncbi:unnamed protein product [Owenia fusiformis]|uniref:Uncharacterized protein n=1 Tax=Owenia fusiformis TaxID=6347 RepID=A0A8J1XMN1_OWEFU|nr:unnamed protein product [Owenia fusiformis]
MCLVGHYCEEGSREPEPCPAGTYSNNVGNPNAAMYRPCDAGMYCNETECRHQLESDAGFYCPGWNSVVTPVDTPCVIGLHCPQGAPAQCHVTQAPIEISLRHLYVLNALLVSTVYLKRLLQGPGSRTNLSISAFGDIALGIFGFGFEDVLIHLLCHVWPDVFELSPHEIQAFMSTIEGMRVGLGPSGVLQYIIQICDLYLGTPATIMDTQIHHSWTVIDNLYIYCCC